MKETKNLTGARLEEKAFKQAWNEVFLNDYPLLQLGGYSYDEREEIDQKAALILAGYLRLSPEKQRELVELGQQAILKASPYPQQKRLTLAQGLLGSGALAAAIPSRTLSSSRQEKAPPFDLSTIDDEIPF